MSKSYTPYNICWNIGIRKRQDGIFSKGKKFKILKNPWWGWLADPFIIKKDGRTYIFAEVWNYFRQWGSIAYAEYSNGKIGKWKSVISEFYHLSYPHLWEENGQIYMCAETNESQSLYLYKAVDFPNKWAKFKIIKDNIICADSTFLKDKNSKNKYCFTFVIGNEGKGHLSRITCDDKYNFINETLDITDDMRYARPGGAFINYENKIVRVAQNCSESYGQSIFFMEVNKNAFGVYKEKIMFERKIEDITNDAGLKPIGMHTYNFSEDYEVTDFRVEKFNIFDCFFYYLRPVRNFAGRNIMKIIRFIKYRGENDR